MRICWRRRRTAVEQLRVRAACIGGKPFREFPARAVLRGELLPDVDELWCRPLVGGGVAVDPDGEVAAADRTIERRELAACEGAACELEEVGEEQGAFGEQ